MRYLEEVENCTEANYKLSKGKEIYNCTKCIKDNILFYNKAQDINCCVFNQDSVTKCLVDYCKICISNNNYFCSSCVSTDYAINKITGSCVKKTEIIPAVTWVDIYRLNMNGVKEINGKSIYGPTLFLRGITSSQINTRHAFLVYLTFKIKHGLRNLQETLKIPAICEIQEAVEEIEDYVNIVDYECIGNSNIDDNYDLIGLEEGDNYGNIINSDFNEINKIINETDDLTIKKLSSITTETVDSWIFFNVTNHNDTFISTNNIFDFYFNGTINNYINFIKAVTLRRLEERCIDNLQIEMDKIEDKSNCSFCSEENLNASLTCILKINDNVNATNISFGTLRLKIANTNQYIVIPALSKINLSYIPANKSEEIPENINIKKLKISSDYNALIIGLSVGVGLIILGSLALILLYCLKWKNIDKPDINNIRDIQINDSNKSDINKSDINLG